MKKARGNWPALWAAPQIVAPQLLGSLLIRDFASGRSIVRIVETEAYGQSDAASHSYRGRTPRTDVMFGPAGFLYVYFTYGMHYCMNIVTGPPGNGEAVLIRAVEPLEGIELLRPGRGDKSGIELTNGPAKLCQALQIDRTWNGHDLKRQPLRLQLLEPPPEGEIVVTCRIGISREKDKPWRFYWKNNPYVSAH